MIDPSGGAARFKPLQPAKPDNEKVEKQFKEVAQLYEKHFMREMMKAMRQTVPESNFIKQNQGEKIFREQLDQEYVEKWGDRGGIGLADLIYDQLIEKYGPQMGLKSHIEKPKGPLPLDDKSLYPRITGQNQNSTQTRFKFELDAKASATAANREIKAPWSGYLSKKLELAPDEWFLEMTHQNGLNSQFSFQGRVPELSLGQSLQGGEKIGLLSPDSRGLSWNLGPGLAPVSE